MRDVPSFDPSEVDIAHFETPPPEEATKDAKTWQSDIKKAFEEFKREDKKYVSDHTTAHLSRMGEMTLKDGLLHIPIDVSLSNSRALTSENSDDRFHLIINPENGHVTTDLDYDEFPTRLASQIPLYQAMEKDLIHLIKNITSYDGNSH